MTIEPAAAHRREAHDGPRTPAADPATEIVRLAAKLIRLQSHFKSGVETLHEASVARPGATPASREQNSRQAAVRSGIEVLQGIAVSMIGEIHDGIEREAFHYDYQPIVATATGAVMGYEALVRWRRGEETVTPGFFLPIAEESRALVKMQQRLLDDVAAAYARLPAPIAIAINWSPAQLSDRSAVSAFIDRVAELNMDPRRIMVEITERTAIVDPELAYARILRLKEMGFQIALDDFGSGYCGFSYLSQLPVDLIKIDGALIANLGRSARANVILDGIVDLAHKLGNRVVAEGVETPQQLIALERLGCDFVQGYVIGRPVREPAAVSVDLRLALDQWPQPQERVLR